MLYDEVIGQLRVPLAPLLKKRAKGAEDGKDGWSAERGGRL